MRFLHRFSIRLSSQNRATLEGLGFKVPPGIASRSGGDPLVTMLVYEDHPSWREIAELVRAWHALDLFETRFSQRELNEARWLTIRAIPIGYTQPEDYPRFVQLTYDPSQTCVKCGTGKRQMVPFRMKGEPKWGKQDIMFLYGVNDELFVRPEVWQRVFDQVGIHCRPVLDTRGNELKTVVQLAIEEEVSLETAGLEAATCPACGRTKYGPKGRGCVPPLQAEPAGAMAKTKEWFGYDRAATKLLLISQALHKALMAPKVKGAVYAPLAERVDGGC